VSEDTLRDRNRPPASGDDPPGASVGAKIDETVHCRSSCWILRSDEPAWLCGISIRSERHSVDGERLIETDAFENGAELREVSNLGLRGGTNVTRDGGGAASGSELGNGVLERHGAAETVRVRQSSRRSQRITGRVSFLV